MKALRFSLLSLALSALLIGCGTDSELSAELADDVVFNSQYPTGDTFQVNLAGHDSPVTAVLKGDRAFVGDVVIAERSGGQLIAADKQVISLDSELSTAGTGIINADGQKWPNGVIPYDLSGATQVDRNAFFAAKADYDAKTSIRWIPRTNQQNYVAVVSKEGCWSYVGRIGGRQELSLGDGCGVNPARHELGHAVGLSHEQIRQDRDQWVTVNAGGSQNAINYGAAGTPIGDYDFQSMMHYRNYYRNGRWDYVPKTGFPPERVGNDEINTFTSGDLGAIAAIYGSGNGGGGNGGGGTGISLEKGKWVSFKVTTSGFTNRYLRHRGNLAFTDVVNGSSAASLKQDASYRVVDALDGTPCYSFESRNNPNHFLRHKNFRLHNDPFDGSDLFRKDATFCAQTGLAGGKGVSLVSRNLPGHYIRHYNAEVWLAKRGGPRRADNAGSFNEDVSWNLAAAWAP